MGGVVKNERNKRIFLPPWTFINHERFISHHCTETFLIYCNLLRAKLLSKIHKLLFLISPNFKPIHSHMCVSRKQFQFLSHNISIASQIEFHCPLNSYFRHFWSIISSVIITFKTQCQTLSRKNKIPVCNNNKKESHNPLIIRATAHEEKNDDALKAIFLAKKV